VWLAPVWEKKLPIQNLKAGVSLQFFWMEAVGCLLEEKGLLLGCLRENRLREEMAERGERMMALKWPAGLWRKTEEDGCVSREEDGGQGAAALIFSFFSKGRGRWPTGFVDEWRLLVLAKKSRGGGRFLPF